jgi:predicted HAD superfamily Cof-like phosphohydrolase
MAHKFTKEETGLEVYTPPRRGKTNYDMVRDFHKKFDLPWCVTLTEPEPEEVMLRVRLMAEEFSELVAAMQLNIMDPTDENFELVADAIADLLYVVYGTAVIFGMPIDAIFEEVHRSNMTKSSETDKGGKITKGEDFDPPDLKEVLWHKT